jgi:hypothetical protein
MLLIFNILRDQNIFFIPKHNERCLTMNEENLFQRIFFARFNKFWEFIADLLNLNYAWITIILRKNNNYALLPRKINFNLAIFNTFNLFKTIINIIMMTVTHSSYNNRNLLNLKQISQLSLTKWFYFNED